MTSGVTRQVLECLAEFGIVNGGIEAADYSADVGVKREIGQ